MLTALRREVQALLAETPARRKPALRRSDHPEALLATELPLVAEEHALEAFVTAAQKAGWRTFLLPNGWLALDHGVPAPETETPPMPEGEAGCCLSLLLRHPAGEAEGAYIRALVKADDAGKNELDKLCRIWHRDFAARLRRHESLPEVLPWLCAAIHHHCKEA